MRKTMSAIAMAVLALASATAVAGPVPVSYTFDKATDSGTFTYHDPGYTKLTDGILGYTGVALNSAAPWVGWVHEGSVNIDFTFSGLTAISAVHVGTTQDNLGNLVLPSVNVYQWVSGSWALAGGLAVPPSPANDRWHSDPSPHCQGDPKFPQLWELKIPHLVQASASSGRTRPALSFSFKR